MSSEHLKITLIGLGSMGATLGHCLLKSGYTVTIWNRTAGRRSVTELVNAGASLQEDIRSAIRASPVLLVCLMEYTNIYETLEAAMPSDGTFLQGRTFINMTSGTAIDARKMSDWVKSKGVDTYVDGGIMTTPSLIATPASFILCSGTDDKTFSKYQDIIGVFGRPQNIGIDPGAASLIDLALLTAMYGMFGGALTAIALLRTLDNSLSNSTIKVTDVVQDMLNPMLQALLPSHVKFAEQLEAGKLDAGENTVEMQAAILRNMEKCYREQDIDGGVLKYFGTLMNKLEDQGRNQDGLAGIATLLEK